MLIQGETGSGKGLLARYLHAHSARAAGRFVELNCSAIPEQLLESELYGHERGAFTDAKRFKKGLFELADRGTLFLDEIGEMAPQLQAKLLRVLETRTFRRVGGSADITVDVRVVAATHRDLARLVSEGRFREDLFFRLNVVPIDLPPLRQRTEDIGLLAEHFIARFCRELIGVNTGPALLGTVGLTNEYTAIGDTVNLANRLETAAPKGGILISYETHQLVRGVFDVTELEPITVKGKSAPIRVFTVQSVKPRSFRDTTRGLEGIEKRTIGRENEFGQRKLTFENTVASNQTHLITMVAEAGTGKSRLLFEFGKWLETLDQPVQIFKGRSVQESTHIPYSLLRGILSASFGINENDRASIARQKLEQSIQKYSSDKDDAILHAHFIGHLIGLDYSTSPYLKGILEDARQRHDRAFHYITQLFADLTRNQPLVILLEDIHWADAGSLDFFESHQFNKHA